MSPPTSPSPPTDPSSPSPSLKSSKSSKSSKSTLKKPEANVYDKLLTTPEKKKGQAKCVLCSALLFGLARLKRLASFLSEFKFSFEITLNY